MRQIRALRVPQLRCRNWRAEALLRMLENTLENAEKPDELVVYAVPRDREHARRQRRHL